MVITTTRPMYIIQIRKKGQTRFFMHWELGILKRQKKKQNELDLEYEQKSNIP